MPKSKQRSNHKKKVAVRREKINQQKKQIEKLQKKFLMDLIEKEKESGVFENTPSFDNPVIDTPFLEVNGPNI
jgi:hypothetical protein